MIWYYVQAVGREAVRETLDRSQEDGKEKELEKKFKKSLDK
jgi:hypothetical protein